MSLLKLLFFVGVSVAMMVSVRAVTEYDDDSTLSPMENDQVMNDEDVHEDNEENAILFDEPASTFPPPDLLHDIVYDEDINEDSEKEAIIFDEPASTFPPVDTSDDIEYDEDINEDSEKEAIIFDEPATTLPSDDLSDDVEYDEFEFDEPIAKPASSADPYRQLLDIYQRVFGFKINPDVAPKDQKDNKA